MPRVNKLQTWELSVHKSTLNENHHQHTECFFKQPGGRNTKPSLILFVLLSNWCKTQTLLVSERWKFFLGFCIFALLLNEFYEPKHQGGVGGVLVIEQRHWRVSASGSSFLDSHRLTPSMLRLQANFSVEYIHGQCTCVHTCAETESNPTDLF